MGVYCIHEGEKFFIDNFADKAHDHHFTTSAWEATLEVLQVKGIHIGEMIKKLIIWSDGGLKTKETLRYFQDLSRKKGIKCSVNFFAPYHGHSEADGHFGLGKRTMRNNAEDGPILSVEEILEAFSAIKSTHVQRIEIVNNDVDVVPLELLIRKWFEFEMKDGHCRCRERSHHGEFISNDIKSKEEKEAEKVAEKEKKERDQKEKEAQKENEKKEKEAQKEREKKEKEEKKGREKKEREDQKEREKNRRKEQKKRK